MSGIVLELQRSALDPEVRLSDLLRKALVVSKKLALVEFAEWVESELNGYSGRRPPDYREIHGQVRGFNSYTGIWMPLLFESSEMGETFSKQRSTQPVSEIEQLVSRAGESGTFHLPFPEKIRSEFSSKGFGFQTQISLFTDQSALVGVLDAVRNIVLNWSLKLEEAGILGEGLSITPQEKAVAQQTPQNVNNFFAAVHGQQIQQGNESAVQSQVLGGIDLDAIRSLLPQLRAAAESLALEPLVRDELKAEVATVETQINSPKPKLSIVKESLKSARSILEGAAGGTAGQLVLELGKVLLG